MLGMGRVYNGRRKDGVRFAVTIRIQGDAEIAGGAGEAGTRSTGCHRKSANGIVAALHHRRHGEIDATRQQRFQIARHHVGQFTHHIADIVVDRERQCRCP